MHKQLKRIGIFVSGTGTNMQRIIEHFNKNDKVVVDLVCCNKADALAVQIAKKHKIETIIINKEELNNSGSVLAMLKLRQIDLIVLAGFIWLIPEFIIQEFPKKIINIHPALLPDYGGKGMYGMHIHEAVIQNKESQSGITIHYLNEKYDEGEIILQAKLPVEKDDTPDRLAQKIQQLEYAFYPKTIEKVLYEEHNPSN